MAKVCIICEKEVGSGYSVIDDPVIKSMRAVKQATRTAKNNTLMVCGDCVEGYQKKRANFEKTFATYLVIAAIFVMALVMFPLLTTGFSLSALLLGLVFGAFILAIPILSSYSPRVEGLEPGAAKTGGKSKGAEEGKKAKKGKKR